MNNNNIEQTKIKLWKSGLFAMSMVGLLFIALFANQIKMFAGIGETHIPTNTITVDGSGKITAIPDVATFSFSVTETAATVAAAQTLSTNKTNAALSALHQGGVATSDIQTLSYNISPHYDYQGGTCNSVSGICTPSKSVLTGYDVSQTIQVKIRDLSTAGDLFTAVGSLGVQNVDSLQFSIDSPEAVQNEAQAAAITDAQTQAQKLASELGVTLVRVVDFTDNGSGSTPQPIMYAMASASSVKASTPEVPAGQQQVTDNVSITYEIR
jgi:uncharacterized protein YggE